MAQYFINLEENLNTQSTTDANPNCLIGKESH